MNPTPPSQSPATAQQAPPPVRKRTVLAAMALMLLLFVALGEVVLRLALPRSDFLQVDLRDDDILGLMIKPGHNGHDRLGFRNPQFPAQADVVAIGDSNTYGINAVSGESWPGHFQSLVGRTTYNMGLGGFGPLQHLHALRTMSPAFKPKVTIVAIYFGNDVMDAYNLAHDKDHWKDFRLSVRPKGALTEADKLAEQEWVDQEKARFMGATRDWLAMNSMVYSVTRHMVLTPLANAMRQKRAAAFDPEVQMPWADPRYPNVGLVFGSRVRAMSVDAGVAQVEEGLKISERAIALMAKEAQAQGTQLVMAFIPTKERVYCDVLKKSGVALPRPHVQLCDTEPAVQARWMQAAQAAGLPVADTAQALADAAERGEAIYPRHVDGHAVSAGYRVMAQAIAAVVKPLLEAK